jgi:hypothetical protein
VFIVASLILITLAVAGGWESWTALRAEAAGFLWTTRPWPLGFAILCGVLALLLTGRVWASLLRGAGASTPPAEAVAAWLGSNLGRYLPGKVWQLGGIAAYLRARGESGSAGLGTSLALQAVVLVIGGAVGVAFAGKAVLGGVDPLITGAVGLVLMLALHPTVLGAVMRFGARLMGENDPPAAPTPRALARTGVLMLAVWGVYGLGLQALVAGLAPGVGLDWPTASGIFAGSYVTGYLVLVAPGGLVVREGAMAALLVAATGVPPGVGAALAVAARLWTTVSELAAFAIAALVLRTHRSPR